jgi:valyl-tRNA synthetase
MLITASWPHPPAFEIPDGVAELQDLIAGIRRFRAEHNLGARKLDAKLDGKGEPPAAWWTEQLAALGRVDITPGVPETTEGYARVGLGDIHAFIPLAGLIDAEAECPRLRKLMAETQGLLDSTNGKLANPNFVDRAPAAVVDKERAKAAEFTATLTRLQAQLDELGC